MKVKVVDIKAKIPDLPANVRDLVTIDPDDASLATVQSFSKKDVEYAVHIGVHKDDPGDKSILDSTCLCKATVPCRHVTAFYAVSYDLLPVAGFISKTEQETTEATEDPLRRLTRELITALASWFEEMERRIRRHDED